MNMADQMAWDVADIARRARSLRQIAQAGGFATPDSMVAIDLRNLVASLSDVLAKLEANTPSDLRKDAA